MHPQLIRCPALGPGYTPITRAGEATADTGFDFGVLRLEAGETYQVPGERETAVLLMDGEVTFSLGGERLTRRRGSLFDEDPVVLHVDAGAQLGLVAGAGCELALLRAENPRGFATRLFEGDGLLERSEHRGRGLLDDAAHRVVRTVFDRRNRPESNLVLGEVITFPGRWSSYPPHHHPQPEIYHYRFTDPRGYGHGELGDEVLRVRHGDTVKILEGQDHAQAAAPGYGMYYLWAIRHLPAAPYTVPEHAEEHRWLLEPDAPFWRPGQR